MRILPKVWYCTGILGLLVSFPAFATVTIGSLTPSLKQPQLLGTAITWTVKATNTNPGLLTFQFNVALPGGPLAVTRDFNVGTLSAGIWTSLPFVWTPSGVEGAYQIQVVAKNFSTGESASKMVTYQISPLVTGAAPVVAKTAHPLVALFSAPSCPAGSSMRVSFQPQSMSKPATLTRYLACHPPFSMNFEIGGMYPSTTYNMFSQTVTAGSTVNGPTVTFTTGALPANIPFPSFTQVVPPGPHTDTADGIMMLNPIQFGGGPIYANVAADLSGKVVWYYYAQPVQSSVMTRPLPNATILTLQSGTAWDASNQHLQYLRQTDLAGNIIKETNAGIIQQELLKLGAINGGPCTGFPQPAPVGSACLDGFNHEALQTLPNGFTAVLVDIEKIYPAGTQGDTTGLPVDIVGDMVVVLDANWQVVWYFDAFEHAGGAPELDINRAAVLGETCAANGGITGGCPPLALITPGIATLGHDWLHGNSLYYWPQDHAIIWSIRNQDWITKLDYQTGARTGNMLWRLGPCGDFAFNNIYNDPWPWNSAQHDVSVENGGGGPMTIFDNGNTRVSRPSGPGSSTGCMPGLGSGNSRGLAFTIDENAKLVTPVISVDLGVFSTADGSAQLLPNGNYFFVPAVVLVGLSGEFSYSIEILPTPGAGTGAQVLNIQGADAYRVWRMPDLYHPPLT